jgi:hypothetical protein
LTYWNRLSEALYIAPSMTLDSRELFSASKP